jgi:Arf/Sar family protein
MGGLLSRLLNMLYTKRMELVLVGLENSGKTTLINVLAGNPVAETCPTIGLNVKMVKRGNLQMKMWDIGGQAQYRSEWGRYTRGCDVIVFVVDAANFDLIAEVRKELHRLLEGHELRATPLLVLANKIDLNPHISEADLIRELNLDYVVDNPWLVIPVSALHTTNVDQVVTWLTKQSRAAGRSGTGLLADQYS